ncbi:hypothetical protein [Paraburkholderia sp. BL25I1N1]|uniref:hypothetical protein n=1 Tax=Paraburkholderia sp. BL25I1N1 TaxID=1938804 RepID=UPI000D48202A|nr:hypothetical protein [Paraburkholderia sp. BL25I1N1]PRY08566.1 hypothetical protein B0G73_102139 [Paraburkholderia sp. BL25I1N1]
MENTVNSLLSRPTGCAHVKVGLTDLALVQPAIQHEHACVQPRQFNTRHRYERQKTLITQRAKKTDVGDLSFDWPLVVKSERR